MAVIKYGYNQSQVDHTLFIKQHGKCLLTALIVYVNDIVVTGNDHAKMSRLKHQLAQEFEIKEFRLVALFFWAVKLLSRGRAFLYHNRSILWIS